MHHYRALEVLRSALEVLRLCAIYIYILLTYLLTSDLKKFSRCRNDTNLYHYAKYGGAWTSHTTFAQPIASKHWRQQFGKDTHICHFGREACKIYPWLVRGWRSPKIKNLCVLLAGRPDFAVTWQCLRFLVYSHKFVIMQNTIVVFSNKFELWIFRLVQKVTFGALDVFCTLLCTTGRHSSQSELRCWSCKPSWIQLMRSSFLILKTSMFLMS